MQLGIGASKVLKQDLGLESEYDDPSLKEDNLIARKSVYYSPREALSTCEAKTIDDSVSESLDKVVSVISNILLRNFSFKTWFLI